MDLRPCVLICFGIEVESNWVAIADSRSFVDQNYCISMKWTAFYIKALTSLSDTLFKIWHVQGGYWSLQFFLFGTRRTKSSRCTLLGFEMLLASCPFARGDIVLLLLSNLSETVNCSTTFRRLMITPHEGYKSVPVGKDPGRAASIEPRTWSSSAIFGQNCIIPRLKIQERASVHKVKLRAWAPMSQPCDQGARASYAWTKNNNHTVIPLSWHTYFVIVSMTRLGVFDEL